LTLTLIDGVESLATIAGIDKIDPYKRKSSPTARCWRWAFRTSCRALPAV